MQHDDLWRSLAAEAFGVDYDQVTPEQRTCAKMLGWRFMYSANIAPRKTMVDFVRYMSREDKKTSSS